MKEKKLQDEIARVAYELYEKRGGVHGCDFDDWVEAEKIVRARQATGKSDKSPAGSGRQPAAAAKKSAAPARSSASPKRSPARKAGK